MFQPSNNLFFAILKILKEKGQKVISRSQKKACNGNVQCQDD